MSDLARRCRVPGLLVAALLSACNEPIHFQSGTLAVAVNNNLLAIVVTPPTTSVDAGAQVPFTGTLQNAPANITPADLQWTVSGPNCVAAACGTLSSTSGASVTYTAPAIAPGPDAHVTLTASAGGASGAVTFSTGANAGNDAALTGDFAFKFFGFELPPQHFPNVVMDTGSIGVAGRFHADGQGHLSNVEVDLNYTVTGPQHHANQIGTYRIDANRRGEMTLNTGTTSVTLRFVVASSSERGRIIEFDSTQSVGRVGSGEFRRQTPAHFDLAAFHGDFAFGMVGEIPQNPPRARLAIAGRFTTDAGGAMTLGYADGPSLGLSFIAPGTFSAPDRSTGRGTTAWVMQTLSVLSPLKPNLAYYVVDAEHAFFITTNARRPGGQDDVGDAFLIGEARAQHLPPGVPLLNGAAIYYTSGAALMPTLPTARYVTVPMAGRLVFTPGLLPDRGTIADSRLEQVLDGSWLKYDATGTFTVATTGPQAGRARLAMALNGVFGSAATVYLTDVNEGFVVGQTGSNIGGEAGYLEAQSFDAASVEGDYVGATLLPGLGSVVNVVFTLNMRNGTLAGMADASSVIGLGRDTSFDGNYNPSGPGRYDVVLNPTAQGLHGDFVAWLIQPGRLLLLPVLNNGGAEPVLYLGER